MAVDTAVIQAQARADIDRLRAKTIMIVSVTALAGGIAGLVALAVLRLPGGESAAYVFSGAVSSALTALVMSRNGKALP